MWDYTTPLQILANYLVVADNFDDLGHCTTSIGFVSYLLVVTNILLVSHSQNFATPPRLFCWAQQNTAAAGTSAKKSPAVEIFCLVPRRGLEPPRLTAYPPQG